MNADTKDLIGMIAGMAFGIILFVGALIAPFAAYIYTGILG